MTKATAISQLSVSIIEEAEEPVSALFEALFGTQPSIYTDADTRKTTVSIFLTKTSRWNASVRLRLVAGLKGLSDCGINIGSAKISVKKLRPQDWAESWKKHFKPIRIGKSLLIKPSWSQVQPLKNQACVILDPGLSFGTGQHATTLFCLEELVRFRNIEKKQSFLDIGTGSGILAISAAKLGYSPVRAFDFDPESVRVSHNNAEQNQVGKHVEITRKDLTKIPLQSKTRFDLICANLIYDVLLGEKKRIVNRMTPTSSLILAGILKTQFAQVRVAYEGMGLKLIRTRVGKEWQSGHFVFRSPPSA